jgi:hypothetical protein
MGLSGFEPLTPALSAQCSNQLSYRPERHSLNFSFNIIEWQDGFSTGAYFLILFKGGDPAAPSGTATLLRLHPSHHTYLGHLPPLRVGSAT